MKLTPANMVLNPSFYPLLEGFSSMIVAKDYKQTGTTYQADVKEFLHFIGVKGISSVCAIAASDLVEYYEYISNRMAFSGVGLLASSTISAKMYAVSLFLDYLVDIKEIHSKVTLPRHKRDRNNSRQIVAVEEIKLMFQCALNQRDKVVLALAYGCGLRRTEIHNLNIGDVFLSQSLLVVRAGKNNKRREIPLANYVIDHLRAYLFHERNEYLLRTTQSGSALVLNNQGQRMHGAQLNQRIHVIVERVGSPELTSKHITLHSLRHSIATHMLDAGASFEFVQDFLGHSGIDTVQIYAKRRAHRAMYNKQFTHEFQ